MKPQIISVEKLKEVLDRLEKENLKGHIFTHKDDGAL